MPQTIWEFAQTLKHTKYGARLEELLIQWDAALRAPRLDNCPAELTKAEIYVIEAVLGVPFDKTQGQRPKERRRK